MLPSWCVLFNLLQLVLLACRGVAKSNQNVVFCDKLDACSCEYTDGSGIVSLWEIDGGNSIKFPKISDSESGQYFYSYNPCTPFNDGGCKGALFCQDVGKDHYNAGMPPLETQLPGGIASFIYKGPSSAATPRQVTITLNCSKSATTPHLSAVVEKPEYFYSVTLTSRCACPGVCKQKSNTGGGGSGLSLGSVLCIILLVVVVVYFILGMVINKYGKSKEGTEIIPNKEFWSDVPSLVKDGCVFAVEKVKGGSGQYEQL